MIKFHSFYTFFFVVSRLVTYERQNEYISLNIASGTAILLATVYKQCVNPFHKEPRFNLRHSFRLIISERSTNPARQFVPYWTSLFTSPQFSVQSTEIEFPSHRTAFHIFKTLPPSLLPSQACSVFFTITSVITGANH